MKLYRVSYELDNGEHYGYDWCSSKRQAQACISKHKFAFHKDRKPTATFEEVVILKLTRFWIINTLMRYASHPDNG